MKLRQTFIAIGLAALFMVGGLTAALASAADPASDTEVFKSGTLPELTDEQKAEMESKMKEMRGKMAAAREKWDTLAQEEKDALYAIQNTMADAQSEIIDKQLELGLIDEDTAKSMKDALAKGNAYMRENNIMPGIGGFMSGHGKGAHHGKGRGDGKTSGDPPSGGETPGTL